MPNTKAYQDYYTSKIDGKIVTIPNPQPGYRWCEYGQHYHRPGASYACGPDPLGRESLPPNSLDPDRDIALEKEDEPVTPEFNYRTIVDDSGNASYVNRLLVATPVTGLVRVEWVAARYGQIIPCNWSMVQVTEYVNAYMPLRYQVADAENMIVKYLVEGEFQWLLMIEHDTCPPPDAFIRINEYIRSEEVPIVSGLYYTKSHPSEPLLYRGRGTSYYGDWELGDKVWVDGVPMGFVLIHAGILKAMWNESPEYRIDANRITRRVFDTPRKVWHSPDSAEFYSLAGTSDLAWCTRIMEEGFFEKAGWGKYQEMEFPFLVDTNIFCKHIDMAGVQYP